MKSLILSTVFVLFGSQAHAMPAIGDYAKYTATSNGQTMTLEQEVIAHDAFNDLFKVKTVTHFGGQSHVTEKITPRAGLLSDAQAAQVLAYCTVQGGSLETLNVANNAIKTCKVRDSQGTTWLGAVPFALVKYTGTQSGQPVTLDLVEFKRGN